jgi:hypothetical protein
VYVVKKLPIAGYSVVKESEESAVRKLQLSILLKFRALSTFVVRAAIRLASRSPRERAKGGGEYRARTGDLLVANQALSQLS